MKDDLTTCGGYQTSLPKPSCLGVRNYSRLTPPQEEVLENVARQLAVGEEPTVPEGYSDQLAARILSLAENRR